MIEVLQTISAPKLTKHSECEDTKCTGNVVRFIGTGANVIFKGSGWTPKYGGSAGSAMKKMDKALAALGIEDHSEGWTHSDGKPKDSPAAKKRTKKNKYVGQLKVD